MPSGYEQSPDYGGPEPTRWGTIIGVAVFVLVAVGMAVFWR
jgi:hypothetical protein